MDLKSIIKAMTPEIRDNLSRAIETGRWPDGSELTQKQREDSMQALIAWDSVYGEDSGEPFKVSRGGKFMTAADLRAKDSTPTRHVIEVGEAPSKSDSTTKKSS